MVNGQIVNEINIIKLEIHYVKFNKLQYSTLA